MKGFGNCAGSCLEHIDIFFYVFYRKPNVKIYTTAVTPKYYLGKFVRDLGIVKSEIMNLQLIPKEL